ncbi:MAG: metallophosphoesterase family protein [Gemmatimonadetes bacterium]|nr:metallophosphoesterase family protein [Gemmatimonadota bacterium]
MTASVSYVVSDLHLGDRHFCHTQFLAWLDGLPGEAALILNGDIVDNPGQRLCAEHDSVLRRLVAESHSRPVVWVRGNHDRDFQLPDPGGIRFENQWEIGRQLLVVHGHDLDAVMPRHRLFKGLFRLFHRALVFAGLPDVHVARFAKKWGFLYGVLNDHVAEKAIRRAASSGHRAVTCGHTHAAMEVQREGRRYLNTGSWTEEPLHFLSVVGERIALEVFPGATR